MVIELAAAIGRAPSKYPFLSLQNMPKTDFTCRDKILGGYYADADTQCQMFHICVKVAGIGVSRDRVSYMLLLFFSLRFLCGSQRLPAIDFHTTIAFSECSH